LFGGRAVRLALFASPSPALALLLCITFDDEHVGKDILVYSHFSKKETK
jgi:hypothetical protein